MEKLKFSFDVFYGGAGRIYQIHMAQDTVFTC